MFVIEKFTHSYDKTEDRISLTCQDSAGEVVRLWLTQRLLLRLTEVLVKFLDDELNSERAGRFVSDMHEFEQSAALSGLKGQAPVKSDALREDVLVTAVDLTPLAKGYRLIFRREADRVAGIVFSRVTLRQFLGILYRLFGKAGWPRHAWPAWFSQEAASGSTPEPLLFH